MLSFNHLRTLAGALALAVAAFVPAAAAQSVSATLEATEVIVQDGVADTTFRIVVTNGDAAALGNVVVVFADGAEVAIGDVAPDATVASESQRRSFDLGGSPSRHVGVPVTLKYSRDGAAVEHSADLVLTVQ